MRRTIFTGILLFAACSSGPSGGGSNQPPPPPQVALTVQDGTGASGPFGIDVVDQLTVGVQVAHFPQGSHAVRVDVMSPGGTLYAQLPATLEIGSQQSGSTSSTLLVRGTTIQSFRQVGTWQLAASLDGAVVAAASVDINE
jgi:hypothetical protein